MIKTQFEQLVENYYYNRLSASERDAFDTRMLVDGVFEEQVNKYMQALAALHLHRDTQLKQRFIERENDRRKLATWKKIARFAALIFFTIGIPLTFLNHFYEEKTTYHTSVESMQIEDSSSSDEIVKWIVEVVGEWDELLSSSSFSTESYQEIMSHYSFDENTDFSGLYQLYDYVTGGVPMSDVSPEIWETFNVIFDTKSDSVINLLRFMINDSPIEEAEKLSESR